MKILLLFQSKILESMKGIMKQVKKHDKTIPMSITPCKISKYELKNLLLWKPSSLSELTPMLFNTGLTHFGSEAST